MMPPESHEDVLTNPITTSENTTLKDDSIVTSTTTTPSPPPRPDQDLPIHLDTTSLPATFLSTWTANPDPTALPFPRSSPPFPLTPIDWQQLALPDSQFTPHTWSNLQHLISTGQLDELKRWPSRLKAYLAWYAHVKSLYGSITNYILSQRLGWHPSPEAEKEGRLVFDTQGRTAPFADRRDFAILRNDWGYAVDPESILHVVVWSKIRLPIHATTGGLTDEGAGIVEAFVRREFRERVGEGEGREGERVLWFRNPTNLQSVRSLEHVHVLIRGVTEEEAERWGWLG
ncbi:uncharacterized protein EI97DRAFT_464735 [Westerdykella ornata]|uniref:Uncharacterized protein n=1 Tax=Westerdykella ornata TaxID=318751 RepID=A0A6A6JWN7_WESOR|nr:uncharacterized protein EI97DRAFT_464735 [Westerdykella ornata]KAF2279479.1 hypothetical protein EI97DRAFT_464735 [Westerdykella ornata]